MPACRPEGPPEIEAYPDAAGCWSLPSERAAPDLAHLSRPGGRLAAARALWAACLEEAALFFWEGRYWLSLPAGEEQTAPAACPQFGAQADAGPFPGRPADRARPPHPPPAGPGRPPPLFPRLKCPFWFDPPSFWASFLCKFCQKISL